MPPTRRELLAGVGTMAGLAGCLGALPERFGGSNAAWPAFQYDSGNTGVAPTAGPTEHAAHAWTFSPGTELWQRVAASPAIAGDTVFIGTVNGKEGRLYALSRAGEVRWSIDPFSPVVSSPVVDDGIVYFGDSGYELFAVEATSGDIVWRTYLDGPIESPLAIVDETVLVATSRHRFHARSTVDGSVRWSRSMSALGPPAVADGVVYTGTMGPTVAGMSVESGDVVWESSTDGGITWGGTVADGVIYVGSSDGGIYAFDAADGSRRWRVQTGGFVLSSPAVGDGTLYVGSKDGYLYAIDVDTGERRWRFETGGSIFSSPIVTDTTVYVGSDDGSIYGVATETGEGRWDLETRGPVRSTPAVVGNRLYVGSRDGGLYAVRGD